MKKIYKHVYKIIASFCIVMLFSSSVCAAKTVQIADSNSVLSEDQKVNLAEFIKRELEYKYNGLYELNNFLFEYSNKWNDSENQTWVDVDVIMDMTLIVAPEDHSYLKGIELYNEESDSKTGREYYNYTYKCLSEQYQVAEQTGYTLRVMLNDNQKEDIVLYDRMVFLEDDIQISLFDRTNEFDEESLLKSGYAACEEIVKAEENSVNNSISTFSDSGNSGATVYRASNAVSYAKAHGADVPTYSAANNSGSDCANFLSYCLNAGGIPQTSSWKPGSSNWIRTGAYNNGGVTPYMENCSYFKKQTSLSNAKAGSFLFWNTSPRSHVALITEVSGSVIKITDHSNVKRSSSEVNRILSSSWRQTAKLYNYNGISN